MELEYARYKTLFLILGAIVLIWGIFGTIDIRNVPYTGYVLSPDRTVRIVREGSPAEAAGVRVGDKVTAIDGVLVEDFATAAASDRPIIGSEGSLTVLRDNTEQTLTFRYGSQPTVTLIAGFGARTLTALAFLVLGLLVYMRNPTRLSTMFCSMSLLFAFALFNRPYFESDVVRRLIGGAAIFLVAMLFAAILDYTLNFPSMKKIIGDRRWLRQAIYVIAGAFGVAIATVLVTTPPMSARRAMLLFLSFGLVFGGYILLSVISVIHTYIKATPLERSAKGLNLILLGMVIGFGPLLVSIIAHLIRPQMGDLPGEQFYGITLLAIPIGLALALMKLEKQPEVTPEDVPQKTRGAAA